MIFSFLFMLMAAAQKAFPTEPADLRLLTINVWSGLDYKGIIRMGEYEPAERRNLRFQALLHQIQEINPDIIFIQEVNPVARYSAKLAHSLGFDQIHQVCIAGIKFGPLGVPVNFKEGIAILARPGLKLKNHDVQKLSGSFGIYGDAITIHLDESIFLLVGKINVHDTPIYLVNVHLTSSPLEDTQLASKFESLVEEGKLSKEEYSEAKKIWESRVKRRTKEMQKLIKFISRLPAESPVILAGDFNDIPNSRAIELIQSSKFFDVYPLGHPNRLFSWDPGDNENISFSSRKTDAKGSPRHGYDLLDAMDSEIPKRTDYIFLSRHFQPDCVKDCRIVLDSSTNGVKPSDHYGLFAEVNLDQVLKSSAKEFPTVTPLAKSKLDFLPILMYDTDTGFGYGGKLFLLNQLKRNESLDLVLFNSTKGERWYHFVFSRPDFERRQGKIYPLAFDLSIDYDKWIKNSFFGIGNESKFKDREYYSREPFELRLTLSRGFSPHLVGQVGAIYRTIRNFNFEENSRLAHLEPALNSGQVKVSSFLVNFRSDTRDSYINPSSGTVLQGEAEFAPKTSLSNTSYTNLSLWFQNYYTLFYPKTVMALRMGLQNLIGGSLPVQVLLPIGGGSTLRGFPQDRFLGKTSAVVNAEIRFPIFWRLGGVAGFDAGKVWSSANKIDLSRWAANSVLGLRFYMDTFVVRADIGFGKESTGFFLNFGHIF